MDQRTTQQVASQFCVVASFGQSIRPNAEHLTIKQTSGTSRTRAEISSLGDWLRVNENRFSEMEVELKVVTYIHEAGHLGNNHHHKPAFWEVVIEIANEILQSEQHRAVVQSQFSSTIDWEKVRYRLVQDVSETCVDRRCESVEERQRAMARAIDGYDEETAEFFDLKRYSWWVGDPSEHIHDEYTVNIDPRMHDATADGVTESVFREFVAEHGRVQDSTHTSFIAPVTYTNGSIREFVDHQYAMMMMRFCDRRGMGYCPMTDVQAVVDGVAKIRDDSDDVKRVCERYAEQ